MAALTMTRATIDRLTASHAPAAARLSEAVGWNQDQADWLRMIALHPEGTLGAWRDGALLGTATLVHYAGKAAWLGMVIVAPDARGQGLGAALVDAALKGCPEPVGLDATEFGAPLYQRRGFQTVAHINRWGGVLRPSDATGGGVRSATPADLAALVALDLRAAGLDRSRLLKRLLEEDDTIVVLNETAGKVRAYGVLRTGRTRSHVGPIVANDMSDLAGVIAAIAGHAGGAPIYLDAVRLPERTTALESFGLSVERTLLRMTRPKTPVMCSPEVVAAMAFEWG